MDLAARAHVLSAEDVAAALGVRLSRGLSPAEVERRRAVHGWNELPAERAMPFYRLMLSQFDDGLVKILLAAAAVSFGLALSESDKSARAMAEPAVIVLILLLNALVGAVQERSAAKAIDALKEYEPDDATVLRCGGEGGSAPELRTVRARELVPGDVVRLSVGDQVPADLRLAKLLSTALRMQQALLTGETAANHKEEAALDETDAGIELQAKRCLLFCGTTVAYGSALGLVVATGGATQMGQIGAQVATTDSGPSPLKQRLDEFGGLLSRLIGAICVCVWLVNIPSFADPAFGGWLNGAVYYFKIAIALAVAAIPEGLPAVVTTCLALGTRRMARRHAIARSLPSVETLGTTSVVCSDKTGTLTTSHMSARALLTFEQPRAGGAGECAPRYYVVDGTGYNPEQGRIHAPRAAPPAHERGGGVLGGRGVSGCAGLRTASPAGAGELASDAELCADAALQALAAGCALCNHSHIHCPEDDEAEAGADGESAAAAANGGERAPRLYRCVGEPTEAALRVLAEKVGIGSGGSAGLHSVPPKAPGGEGAPEDACMPAQLSSGASASGAEPHTARWQRLWRPRAFLEFTRDRRSMSVLCERGGGAEADAAAAADPLGCGRWRLFVKGAAENVLERCTHCLLGSGALVPLELSTRAQVEGALAALCGGTEALRTLAVAARTSFGKEGPPSAEALADVGAMAAVESGLVLLGFVGIADPVRPEVAPAIRLCRRAGIRVIVVTGDNVHTGLSVCRQAGIITAEDEHEHARARAEEAEEEARDGGGGRDAHSGASPVVARACVPPRRRYLALTGRELCALPEAEQLEAAAQCALFARTEPAHKLRLVALLQTLGEVVAMTGDGVNDAPALKKADIGVAMGSGTAVAKGAADMILADDNFATIVGAVEEGRTIYANTKAFIRYLVSSNVGEVVAIVLTALLGMPGALAPVQLLWVNLVTDGLPAMALSFNPAAVGAMETRPRSKQESFIDSWLVLRFALVGCYVGVATVGAFAWWFMAAADGPHATWWQLSHCHQCARRQQADGGGTGPSSGFEGVDCAAFDDPRPRSVALSTLVLIEMLNSLNAISEDGSLLRTPPWANGWLLLAIALSLGQHAAILYVPPLASVFGVAPLGGEELLAILSASFPVLLLDEALKLGSRLRTAACERGRAGPTLPLTMRLARGASGAARASYGGYAPVGKQEPDEGKSR